MKDLDAEPDRQPLPGGQLKMRLKREPVVGSLYPIGRSNPLHFTRHGNLIFKRKKVFDDGVTKSNVEAAIRDFAKIGGVTNCWSDVRIALRLRFEVYECDLHII